jgi:hypothetical protein
MPSVLKDDLYGLIRHSLSGAAVGLIVHGVLTTGQADQLVPLLAQLLTGVVLFVGAVGWSWLQKHWSAQVKGTALALAGVTEQAVEQKVALGIAPSVLTAPTIVPTLVPIPIPASTGAPPTPPTTS